MFHISTDPWRGISICSLDHRRLFRLIIDGGIRMSPGWLRETLRTAGARVTGASAGGWPVPPRSVDGTGPVWPLAFVARNRMRLPSFTAPIWAAWGAASSELSSSTVSPGARPEKSTSTSARSPGPSRNPSTLAGAVSRPPSIPITHIASGRDKCSIQLLNDAALTMRSR